MIVFLAGAIQAFVMYCVNGTSRSSLLIESTDSMIYVAGMCINPRVIMCRMCVYCLHVVLQHVSQHTCHVTVSWD